jgi:hypothetical protein
VFGWSRGEYQFNPKAQPPAETVRLQMSTAAIVYEGVKRSYDTARLLEALGEIAGKYVHPAEDHCSRRKTCPSGRRRAGCWALMDGQSHGAGSSGGGDRCPRRTPTGSCTRCWPRRWWSSGSERRTGTAAIGSAAASADAQAPGDRPWEDDEEVLELEDEVPASDEEGHVRERLLGALAAMRRMDYFELLGLRRDAPAEAVRSAAVELLREYRVDGPNSSAEVRTLVQQIADLVGQAHDTLVEPGAGPGTRPSCVPAG